MEVNAFGYQFGYTASSWTGLGFYFWKSNNGNEWRPPLAITCFWALLFLAGMYFVPESPRYLVFHDRIDEARDILEKLHDRSGEGDHTFARAELYQIQKQVAIDQVLGSSWLHVFRRHSYRLRALYIIGTIVICQCSGSLVINSKSTCSLPPSSAQALTKTQFLDYGPTLYEGLGYSTTHQLLYQCGWITMSLGLVIISGLIIDRFPRPKFMCVGLMICMSCLIVEAAIIANFKDSNNYDALRAGVAMLFVYQIGLCIFLDGETNSCWLSLKLTDA